MRVKPWLTWTYWIAALLFLAVMVGLVVRRASLVEAAGLIVAIGAILLPHVLATLGPRPKLTLRATPKGWTTTERGGVPLAEVGVLLQLHNEGSGEAKYWKIEINPLAEDFLHVPRESKGIASDQLVEEANRIVWQSKPGEPLAPDAEMGIRLVTDRFPMSEGLVATMKITADRAAPMERSLLLTAVATDRHPEFVVEVTEQGSDHPRSM
jgi:hypothetical protein